MKKLNQFTPHVGKLIQAYGYVDTPNHGQSCQKGAGGREAQGHEGVGCGGGVCGGGRPSRDFFYILALTLLVVGSF